MIDYGPEFEFGGLPVGLFKDGVHPAVEGEYSYEPYRGPGHYDMSSALGAGQKPRCSYANAGQRVFFDVTACPEYGFLSLENFEVASDEGPPPISSASCIWTPLQRKSESESF